MVEKDFHFLWVEIAKDTSSAFGKDTPERCRYSLFVDDYGVIRPWRGEGGSTPMKKCYEG